MMPRGYWNPCLGTDCFVTKINIPQPSAFRRWDDSDTETKYLVTIRDILNNTKNTVRAIS